jgi:cystathionine gamma-synthase
VVDAMVNGYPRFFIHRDIQAVGLILVFEVTFFLPYLFVQLAGVCEKKFGNPGEKCFLFPAAYIANACRQFMINRSPDPSSPVPVRLVQYFICPGEGASQTPSGGTPDESNLDCVELHVVLFQEDAFSLGKQFWQHTGLGVSSRLASAALDLLVRNDERPVRGIAPAAPSPAPKSQSFQRNKHYGTKARLGQTSPPPPQYTQPLAENVGSEHDTYIEERYGRNLPKANAALAKTALRRRIAGVLVNDSPSAPLSEETPELGTSKRGVDVTEDDVFLFPTGMAAIWSSHQLALAVRPQHKSVCFG